MGILKKFLQTDEPAASAKPTAATAPTAVTAAATAAGAARLVLRRAVVTEKSSFLEQSRNQYVFEVASGANKQQVAAAVSRAYGVTPLKVRVSWVPAKQRRRGRIVGRVPAWKKAVVTLPAGKTIRLREAA